MEVLTIRTWINNDCTIGRLNFQEFNCLTLELPWLDNKINVSCIPAGVYEASLYNSPKHGRVVLLKDVEGRTFIEIHSGNFTRQILGCILVGDSLKYLDDDDTLDVTNSYRTLQKLLGLLPQEFLIEIIRSE